MPHVFSEHLPDTGGDEAANAATPLASAAEGDRRRGSSQRAAREAAWGEMRRVQSGHGSPCMAGRAGRSVSRHLKEGAGAMAVGEGVSQAEGEPVPAPEERLCWKSSGTRRKPGWLGTRVGKSSRRQGSEGTGTQMVGLGGRREAGRWLGEERWQTPAASIRRVT